MLKFEWDNARARANLAKHSASFKEVASVFFDPLALTFPDLIRITRSARNAG